MIKQRAFNYDKIIETIIIPSSVEKIKWGTFYLCKALKKIYISQSVKIIQEHTFLGAILI